MLYDKIAKNKSLQLVSREAQRVSYSFEFNSVGINVFGDKSDFL